MPLTIRPVRIPAGGGPVSLRVADTRHPQAIEARVHRFANMTTHEAVVGSITEGVDLVPLGAPSVIDGKIFVVDGFVVPFGDDPPTPYQVVVTVLQGGQEVDQAVPEDNGSGKIGRDGVRFRFPFAVEAV
jgi:hypothetical protein